MFETVKKNLEDRGYSVNVFATGEEAAAYLNEVIDGMTIGCGGSMTLKELGLYDSLASHNTLYYHGIAEDRNAALAGAAAAQVYICSANGLSEAGDIINIDGTGNRVASTLFGHEKAYFIIGRNKLAPTYEEALWRARNVAAPKNAQRLNKKTPCALKGDKCYDCKSPDRICNGLVVHWRSMNGMEMEVLLVDEDLGL